MNQTTLTIDISQPIICLQSKIEKQFGYNMVGQNSSKFQNKFITVNITAHMIERSLSCAGGSGGCTIKKLFPSN